MSKKSPAGPEQRAGSVVQQGIRRYEMPFSAPPPRLVNPGLGLPTLVGRASSAACYSIDVTLLDTPDHRLLRSGVVLAHRVLDGRGEWYLGGGDWEPFLPAEQVEPMSHGDLPTELADLVMPFRRRGTLGPVAALTCDRREFWFRDGDGGVLALLRDECVSVSRGGLIIARYREATLHPGGPGVLALTVEQLDWIDQAMASAGATRVETFPGLAARLGAPATGRTDYPEPPLILPDSPFATFVSAVLTARLRSIVAADLVIRASLPGGAGQLVSAARSLAAALQGLSSALDSDWLQDLDEELRWLGDQAGSSEPLPLLRRERYLNLLERLVTATRNPRLGESTELGTADVLATLLDSALSRLRTHADRLEVRSGDEAWAAAVEAAGEFTVVRQAVVGVLGKPARRLGRRLATPLQRLTAVQSLTAACAGLRDGVDRLDPVAAFEAGRHYELGRRSVDNARSDFLTAWAKAVRKLT